MTCLTDDLYESPKAELELLGAAFDAYDDIGIRATVSAHVVDKNFLDTIPYAWETVPEALQDEVNKLTPLQLDDYLAFVKAAHAKFHGRSGRLRFMLAPSAPQRCTPKLMLAANDLAREWQVPFHTHIVETKVQGVTGPVFHGKSLIAYMNDLGLLNPWTTIAHSIWVTDDDIEIMGKAGVSIVHNTISNQKLGAGVAPIRKLLEAGVNVGIGVGRHLLKRYPANVRRHARRRVDPQDQQSGLEALADCVGGSPCRHVGRGANRTDS